MKMMFKNSLCSVILVLSFGIQNSQFKNATETPIFFLGNWMFCSITSGGVTVMLNECSTVVFSEGGKGKLIGPTKVEYAFTYEIRTDTIIFSEINLPLCNDRVFDFKIIDNRTYFSLVLNSNKYKLILNRRKF